MNLLKIALKSFYRKNLGNQTFLLCAAIFLLLPALLYNISSSVAKQVDVSQKEVFGAFSDIFYEPLQSGAADLDFCAEDTAAFLEGFSIQEKGVLSTVYSEELNESRKLNAGYADEAGLKLAAVALQSGRFPIRSGEIALTESIAQHFSVENIGDKISIAGTEYVVCGIAGDFGRLWVHGEIQEKQKIAPVNAFLTQSDAALLLEKTATLTRQILLIQSPENIIVQVESPNHFKNTSISERMMFHIPPQFRVIVFAVSLVVFFLILVLNGKKLQKRIANYYRLGLTDRKITTVVCLERFISFILGGIAGGILSVCLTYASVSIISKYVEQTIIASFDFSSFFLSFGTLFIGVVILTLLYTIHETDNALKTVRAESIGKTKKIHFNRRFCFGTFSLKKYGKSYALLILLVVFSYTLISYGVFYGNYFRNDITEGHSGMLPRDYDFQFVTRAKNAAPWEDHNNDPIIFFTDTYEKLGAKEECIEKLQEDDMVSSIKAYRENNKYSVLLDKSQLDAYIDASDFFEDGQYDENGYTFMRTNSLLHYEKFGYSESDLLVAADILGYPEEVLETLARSVVEGEINIDKIKSGEEIILRVPAFRIGEIDSGGIFMDKTDPDTEGAYNSTTFKVGDEVTLTALLSDEMINGAVPQSYLDQFRREDITVKIGAIIRNSDGILYSNGTFGRTFSFLTVNEAFEKLGVTADYSIVSVYGNSDYSDTQLVDCLTDYTKDITQSGGNMIFENWITDTKANKIFNLMIDAFVITLIIILVITTLIILMSQFYNLVQFSMKNYALLRLNGLPFKAIVRQIFIGAFIVSLIGGAIGIPISLLAIRFFGIDASFDVMKTLINYFPLQNLAYVFGGVVIISLVSVFPGIAAILKNKKNVLEGISGE